MSVEPVCLNDSEQYNLSEYPQIAGSLKGCPDICSVDGYSFRFQFTGILIMNETPVVLFPKNYDIPQDTAQKRNHAGVFVRVLLRYRDEPYHAEEENRWLYGKENGNARIAVAFQILEDYLANGILERERVLLSHADNGRTDWGATINKTMPTVNHGRVIYDDTIVRRKRRDDQNLIKKIHQYIVHEIMDLWGWMYGMDIPACLTDAGSPPCPEKNAVSALYWELKQTYIQREIRLIKNMIAYLTAKSEPADKRNQEILGTQYFSFVWEAICGYLFHNKYSMLKAIVPQPEWEGIGGRISQRPDIISDDGETLYILDAKYYNYKKNLPGWHDVVKQMFYRHTMIQNLGNKVGRKLLPNVHEVINAFLFPGDESKRIQYLGRVKIKEDPDLGEVKAYAVNQWDAMKTYAYRNNDRYRDELLAFIKQPAGEYPSGPAR